MTTTTAPTTLDEPLSRFLGYLKLEPEDYQLRCEALKELGKILEPFGKIHPFGSFYLGLANVDSAVDVYLEDFDNEGSRQDVLKIIKGSSLETFCGSAKYMTEGITHNAMSLPILKLVHTVNKKKIKFEISTRNLMSLQNSRLIKFMASLDPVVLPLILFVRSWAEYHNLISMKHRAYDSYTITLLVMTLLVREKVLPSIQQLQDLAATPILAPGSKNDNILWHVSFCDDKAKVQNFMKANNIGRKNAAAFEPVEIVPFVLKWFEFIDASCVSKPKKVILTSSGIVKTSQDYLDDIELQELEEMKLTHNETQLKVAGGFSLKHAAHVQDPFDLSHNTTKVTSADNRYRFRKTATGTLAHLKSKEEEGKIRLADFFVDVPGVTVDDEVLNIMRVNQGRVKSLKDYISKSSKKLSDTSTSPAQQTGVRHYGTLTNLSGFSRQAHLIAIPPNFFPARRISFLPPSSSPLLSKWAGVILRRKLWRV